MTRARDAPTHGRYSRFRLEEATITDVNRRTWTVTADTRHSSRTVTDIQCLAPYHHYEGGEGFHHLPEVGAICYLAWPSDDTPPFIMGYIGAAAAQTSPDGDPVRPTPDGLGSATDVGFRSRRPDINPGDIALTTRDENFIFLRRGGIVQIGATPISQRIYIPVLNYIKDFCENYEMHAFGGDIQWTVGRQEHDPSGNAPSTYTFHLNEFAQDEKATVRIRHLPLSSPGGGDKAAWEVFVAPQNINRDTGEVSNEVYSLVITTAGDQTEVVGGARHVTVKGDDTLEVQGKQEVTVQGDAKLTAQGAIEQIASGNAVLGGATVKIGSRGAASPGVLGDQLITWFGSAQWVVAGTVATVSPASIAALQQILSLKVTIE
jgi:hypothetical protein